MKVFFTLCCILWVQLVYTQRPLFMAKPVKQGTSRFKTPEILARELTANFSSEKEKVRSIFTWITENISYKVNPWYRTVTSRDYYDDDTSTVLKPLNERVAENVLRTNMALCDGYARLFATLCRYAGIEAEVITGYARTNSGSVKFRSNHTWNAVRIDGNWHLLDATWASGYVTFGNGAFIRQYNALYFLTPPEDFIYDHYPENLQWAFLPNPPTLKEFHRAPFRAQRFIKSGVVSYSPEKGVIDAAEGDTLTIQLQTERLLEDLEGTYDPMFDSTTRTLPSSWAFVKPVFSLTEKKVTYQYVVPPGGIEWLNLVMHDDVIMRYRVNMITKKDDYKAARLFFDSLLKD